MCTSAQLQYVIKKYCFPLKSRYWIPYKTPPINHMMWGPAAQSLISVGETLPICHMHYDRYRSVIFVKCHGFPPHIRHIMIRCCAVAHFVGNKKYTERSGLILLEPVHYFNDFRHLLWPPYLCVWPRVTFALNNLLTKFIVQRIFMEIYNILWCSSGSRLLFVCVL